MATDRVTRRRIVVRGRTEDPVARLETAEGDAVQPTRFGHGMWAIILFIGSEAMLFAAFFTTYFYLRTRLPEWEPVFGHKPGWEGLVMVNTIVLVTSSFTMQAAVWAIRKGARATARNWLFITIVLGVAFLSGQGYEYTQLGFLPRDGIFAGAFYTLTGFHGAHVTGGVLFIGLVLFRLLKGHFSPARHLAVEVASLYWHFVDVVWIALYTTIYVIG